VAERYHASLAAIPMPARITRLPVDARGFPVPKFVAWINGQPDHRVVDTARFAPAINHKQCWICGEPLGRYLASVIGPMCAVNRIISEPPSHRECAEFSIAACPFLSRPHAHRREAGLPQDTVESAGVGLKRNPGVICLWIARDYRVFRPQTGGLLFSLGNPVETVWYHEGRRATRDEVVSALYRGTPALIEIAQEEGRDAEDALSRQLAAAMPLLPRVASAPR
jgi:hypothetical protein